MDFQARVLGRILLTFSATPLEALQLEDGSCTLRARLSSIIQMRFKLPVTYTFKIHFNPSNFCYQGLRGWERDSLENFQASLSHREENFCISKL